MPIPFYDESFEPAPEKLYILEGIDKNWAPMLWSALMHLDTGVVSTQEFFELWPTEVSPTIRSKVTGWLFEEDRKAGRNSRQRTSYWHAAPNSKEINKNKPRSKYIPYGLKA